MLPARRRGEVGADGPVPVARRIRVAPGARVKNNYRVCPSWKLRLSSCKGAASRHMGRIIAACS